MDVFISYQRADTAFAAHCCRYALAAAGHQVFIDTGSIPVGEAFRDVIRTSLAGSDLVLILIGPAFDVARLHEPLNPVSYEWRQARFYGCQIHPVLVDGARMPSEDALPPELRWLPQLNASPLTREALARNIDDLVNFVPRLARRPRGARRVLWVDDNPANNEYERAVLRPAGVTFDNVVSTSEAVEQLRSAHYDLVITDLGRRGSSDRSLVAGEKLLADPVIRQGGPPVLIYAGALAEKQQDVLLQSGAVGVTSSRERLFDLVYQYLGVLPSTASPDSVLADNRSYVTGSAEECGQGRSGASCPRDLTLLY